LLGIERSLDPSAQESHPASVLLAPRCVVTREAQFDAF
jgi:hypothetical protein